MTITPAILTSLASIEPLNLVDVHHFGNGIGNFEMPAPPIHCGNYTLTILNEPARQIFVNATSHMRAYFIAPKSPKVKLSV